MRQNGLALALNRMSSFKQLSPLHVGAAVAANALIACILTVGDGGRCERELGKETVAPGCILEKLDGDGRMASESKSLDSSPYGLITALPTMLWTSSESIGRRIGESRNVKVVRSCDSQGT